MAITTVHNELIAVNAISGTAIADNAVTSVHIAKNNVGTVQIAQNSVTSVSIALNNVTGTQIAMNSITSTQLADNAVTATKIPDGTQLELGATNFSGSVGIGTTSPEYELEVKASTDASINIRAGTNSGDFAGLYFGDTDYPAEGRITYQNSDNKMRFWSDRQHVMTLDDNARVGIGTASPASALHISGGDNTAAKLTITNTANTNTYSIHAQNNAHTLNFQEDGTTVMSLATGGKLGIGTQSPAAQLHVATSSGDCTVLIEAEENSSSREPHLQLKGTNTSSNPIIEFGDSVGFPGTIEYENSDNSMRFGTNAGERLRIDSSGRVGINRTPTKANCKLEIGGADNVPLIQLEASGNFGGFGIGSNALNMYYNDNRFMYINNVGDVYIPSGSLHIGTTSTTGVVDGGLRLTFPSNEADGDLFFISNGGGSNATPVLMYVVQGEGFSTNHGAMAVGRHTGNSRSINAGGTINASGADYAEYMLKSDSCGDIAKGDVVGVDADGKLTKKFSEAKSFVTKSTDPSYVGGDTWWTEKEPEPKYTDDTKSTKTDDFKDWETRMEAARAKVDRIAFSGQVPVNITGSFNVGDYVYPQKNGTGIQAVAKSTPTFEEYQLCVGKIWATMEDGRPLVAVKIG
jgi:hypothetical protein